MLEVYKVGNADNLVGATKIEDLGDMKGITERLGENFKADGENINKGFPILKWQDE